MKKRFVSVCVYIVTIVLLSLLYCSNVFAEQTSIVDIINKNTPASDSEIFDTSLYQSNMQGEDLTDKTLVRAYYTSIWWKVSQSPDELIKIMNEGGLEDSYIVLSNDPYFALVEKKQGKISVSKNHEYRDDTKFIEDIKTSKVYQSKLIEANTEITGILCFDGNYEHNGVVVYYIAGDDTVVMYYEDYNSEAQVYTLSDFQKYGVAYFEYSTSYEQNFTEDGEPIYGGKISFNTYVADVYEPSVDMSSDVVSEDIPQNSERAEISTDSDTANKDNRLWWLFGGVIFSIVIIVAVVYIAKKK